MYNVDVIKNAETIRYLRNDDNELIGIQKSKSGSINVKIIEQIVDEVRFINQIDGNIFPEADFPNSGKKLAILWPTYNGQLMVRNRSTIITRSKSAYPALSYK